MVVTLEKSHLHSVHSDGRTRIETPLYEAKTPYQVRGRLCGYPSTVSFHKIRGAIFLLIYFPCMIILHLPLASSSAGRAPRSQCGGRGCDPLLVHQNKTKLVTLDRLFLFS